MSRRPWFGLGTLDLFLVVVTCASVWTHTPIGGLGSWAIQVARGTSTSAPEIVSHFRGTKRNVPWVTGELPDLGQRVDGVPEPYQTALRLGWPKDVTELQTVPGTGDIVDRVLERLKETNASDLPLELERLILSTELVDRAILRAQAAGEAEPRLFATHRRYLPAQDEVRAAHILDGVLGLATVLDLSWPVDVGVRISSPFGYRVHPTLKTKKFHNGVDLPVPVGTPIHSIQDGTLRTATHNSVSGNYVIIDHPGGIQSSYCHLSKLPTKRAGDRVERGENIGLSGNTGRSTGPHLHFILKVDGTAIDAAPFRRRP